jgi:uncharacterized protein YndB with AHSA1/START domain
MRNDGSFDVMAQGDREIVITRAFDAPQSLVFDAWTKPELVERWLGVRAGWTFEVCEIDLRVGGSYRYVWRSPGGTEMGMRGVFQQVVPPAKLVSSETFDQPWYPGEMIGTVTFEESAGKTTVTMTLRYESKQARDGVLASPMQTGIREGFDVLENVLASVQP